MFSSATKASSNIVLIYELSPVAAQSRIPRGSIYDESKTRTARGENYVKLI